MVETSYEYVLRVDYGTRDGFADIGWERWDARHQTWKTVEGEDSEEVEGSG